MLPKKYCSACSPCVTTDFSFKDSGIPRVKILKSLGFLKLKSNQNICNWIEILLRVVLAHHALASAGKNSKLKKKRILIGNCLSFKTVINVNNAKSVEMGLG